MAAEVKKQAHTALHLLEINQNDEIKQQKCWLLHKSDAIIFGSPKYLVSVFWQFKKFADAHLN